MASEDYEIYRVLQQERVRDGASRRATNKELFGAARHLAAQAGLTLVQHTEVHYGLQSPAGWLLNIYSGNHRLYHDRQKPKPPFLKVKPDWNLLDVVRAAVAASNNTDAFAKEINWNLPKIVTEQDIQVRAYYLWEAAGRPDGSGQSFWLQAEKELRWT